MTSVRLVIREVDQDWSGLVTQSQVERATAALNADPETFGELDIAMGSFGKRLHREQLFLPELEPGDDTTPGEEGVAIIDLAARLLVLEYAEELSEHRAGVAYFDGEEESDEVLNYTLADDWLITSDLANWRAMATERRAARARKTELDVRAVLYGQPLLEFVARETFAAFPRRHEVSIPEPRWDGETEEMRVDSRDLEFIRKVHADWLLTPRPELAGETPRRMLYATRDEVDRQMRDREHNWSFAGHPPVPVPLDSNAFRLAAIGFHEAIVYYDVVRDLIGSCWLRLEQLSAGDTKATYWTAGDFLVDEVPRLKIELERILRDPHDEFDGRSPWSYIENERSRMPEGGSYRDHMIDPDCPCCQMLADLPGVGFWRLDGCNMDSDFAFDLDHESKEEWEAEQRRHAELDRRFEERLEERRRLELGEKFEQPAEDSIWNRTLEVDDEKIPVGMRIFNIGCILAGLIVDIRDGVPRDQVGPESQGLIDQLNRDFSNLRALLESADLELSAAQFEPAMQQFVALLEAIAQERPALEDDCHSLATSVKRILTPPQPACEDGSHFDFGDDIPF